MKLKKDFCRHFYKLMGLKLFFIFTVSIISMLLVLSNAVAKKSTEKKLSMVFIKPNKDGNPYWDFVSDSMRKAADDYGIDLQIVYGDKYYIHHADSLIDILSSMEKPDYLIYIYQQNLGLKLLEFAEKNQIKSFILNTTISKKDIEKVGKPTQFFKYWIGHSYPDLVDIAFQLSKKAYRLAKSKPLTDKNENIYSVVLSGSRDSDVANKWNHGVTMGSAEIDDYKLQQIVYSDFNADKGYDQVKGLLGRYPNISVIMSVDENVALSAVKALEEMGRSPGEDIFVVCSAAMQPALEMVEKEKLTASYALSIWSGVYAIVYLSDYHHGIISAPKEITYNFSDTVILPNDIQIYQKIMSDNLWQHIDYKYFSLRHSQDLMHSKDYQEYDFSTQAIVSALKAVN